MRKVPTVLGKRDLSGQNLRRPAGAVAALVVATATCGALSTAAAATTFRATPTSTSACPTTRVAVPNADDFRSTASNTTFNATGDRWLQKTIGAPYHYQSPDYTVEIGGDWSGKTAATGFGDCYIGGMVQGTFPLSKDWGTMKKYNDSPAIFATHGLSIFNLRLDDIASDDLRAENADSNDSYYVGGSYFTNTRDDCFSTAHAALTVVDTLAECYSVVSWRHAGGNFDGHDGVPFPVTLTNDLLWLKPQLSNPENHCPSQMSGGKGSGQIWKMDGYGGDSTLVHVSNTIFRADLGNDYSCTLTWAKGTFTNDTMVWTGKGKYPGTLPAGVKLTTDVSVWNNAVTTWLNNHPAMASQKALACPGC